MRTNGTIPALRRLILCGSVLLWVLSDLMAAPYNSVFNPGDYVQLTNTLIIGGGTVVLDTKDGVTAPTLSYGSTNLTGVVVTNQDRKVFMALYCFGYLGISNGVTCTVTGNLGAVLASAGDMTIRGTLSAIGSDGYTSNHPGAAGGIGGSGAESGVRQASTNSAPPGSTRGKGGDTAVTPGRGFGAADFQCGGGYGGAGGRGYRDDAPIGYIEGAGAAYGSDLVIDLFGGSGGGGSLYGGAGGGGGSVELVAADTLTVDGATLLVNGGNAAGGSAYRPAGGGSGGGIVLAARQLNFSGSWSVQARGGDGQPGQTGDGGGGGGGRIAFYSTNTFSSPPAGVSVAGGGGPDAGEDGAIGTFRYNGDGGSGSMTYPFGVFPVIVNSGIGNAVGTGATAYGLLSSTGASPATVFLLYGGNDSGPDWAGWTSTNSPGVCSTGSVSVSMTGLIEGRTYYCRFCATNAAGVYWSDAVSFDQGMSRQSYSRKMKITFTNYNRVETLTNFPALVVFSNGMANGFSYANFASASGWDLRFMNSNETRALNYEIESWRTNTNSCVWVQVPELRENSWIWAYWGNASATSFPMVYTTNGATWSNGYTGVWHLNATNSAGVAPVSVGTNNAVPVNVSGANVGVPGVIAGAFDFTDSGSDYLRVDSTLGMWTNNATLSCWANLDSVSESGAFVKVGKCDPSGTGYGFGVGSAGGSGDLDSNGNQLILLYEGKRWIRTTNNIGTGWHHITMVVNGSGCPRAYLDGRPVYSDDSATVPSVPTGNSGTGGYGARYVDATIDEVEISSMPRSSNWIWACYQNTASNAGFWGCSSVTPVSTGGGGAVYSFH